MRTRRTSRLWPVLAATAAIGLVSCMESSATVSPSDEPPEPAPVGTSAPESDLPREFQVPIVFVHGFFGSGVQFRSEALRFTSNGYPADRIRAFDYGTVTVEPSILTAFIDNVRREFEVPKVHLVAHSLGANGVGEYVADRANADRVDKVMLIDGGTCPQSFASCRIIKATELGQSHVEASTSAESFDRLFRYLMDKAPQTTKVVAEDPERVEIAGKVLDLQTNAAPVGVEGQVWEINPATGARVGSSPHATFTVGADGAWGPTKVNGDKHYEIAVARDRAHTFHFYYQPFLRSDHLLRLLTVPPDSATAVNTNLRAEHSAVTVTRYREFWRTHGEANDTLRIFTTGQAPVDVLQPVKTDIVAVHIFDDQATPGRTSQALVPFFATQPFQTGVDVFLPASNPPTGTVTVVNVPRGDETRMQSLAAPNWPSSTDHINFDFNDYVQ